MTLPQPTYSGQFAPPLRQKAEGESDFISRIRSQPALQPFLALPIWACSGGTLGDGRPDKSPRDWRKPWQHAKSNDPETWGTFEQVASAAIKFPQRVQHVGIMSGSAVRVLDWDHKPHAEQPLIVSTQAALFSHTYQEISLSGRGLRCLFLAGDLDFKKRKFELEEGVELEVFASNQYAIVTGNATSQEPVREAAAELLDLLAILDPPAPPRPAQEQPGALTGRRVGGTRAPWEVAAEQWDLGATLENFGYVRKGHRRYLAPTSTTGLAGVMVYDGDNGKQLCYSNHGNDPLNNGKLNDVFEVWTILAHGGNKDAAVREAREIFGLSHASELSGLDKISWDDPEVLLRGRQHIAATGSHGNAVSSYSNLWLSVVNVINLGRPYVRREGDVLLFTQKGMDELYARAGGRMVDRRQQLSFLNGQGMVGKLVRGEQGGSRACWLLEMPLSAEQLPMWAMPRGSL